MQIVYLDQNKWIDLARAVHRPAEFPTERAVLEALVAQGTANKIAMPLTTTNLYETQKINDPRRRAELALVQATLSQGLVFRGRHKRLEVEVINVLRSAYGLPPLPCEPQWFLSNVFFESTLEWDDPRFGGLVSENAVAHVRQNPPHALFEYLVGTPEDIRTTAVAKFSEGIDTLRADIEKRRERDANETMAMRRRIQGALLVTGELDLICTFIAKAQIPDKTETDVLREQCRRIVTDAPTYDIEREIAVRLEAQINRPIEENDFRDMQSFCAVVAYADIIVTENQFSNLAKQGGLDKKYKTTIATDLHALPALLDRAIASSVG